MSVTGLVPSASLSALLQSRDAILERIEKAMALMAEVRTIGAGAFTGWWNGHFELQSSGYRRGSAAFNVENLDMWKKTVDAEGWDHLLKVMGLRTFMSAEARKKWDADINAHAFPELTRENVEATFGALYARRSTMFEDGVIQVFRSLSYCYKTNCPRMFGKRLVLRGVVNPRSRFWPESVTHGRGVDSLDDLLRVMHVVDGKPEPDHRQGAYRLLNEAKWPSCGPFELHGYVSLRGFKNGNCHLTFLRPDLVEKLNGILAKNSPGCLPAKED